MKKELEQKIVIREINEGEFVAEVKGTEIFVMSSIVSLGENLPKRSLEKVILMLIEKHSEMEYTEEEKEPTLRDLIDLLSDLADHVDKMERKQA